MAAITYELKYCERCGSLGLRRLQSGEAYCGRCEQILIKYSVPGGAVGRSSSRRSKTQTPTPLPMEVEAQLAIPFGRLP